METRHHLLPFGQQPIWITVEELKVNQLTPFLANITASFENETIVISRLNLMVYKKLCAEMKWKFANFPDIIGTETKCLITFGIPTHQNLEELMSRARNLLIIVTEDRRYLIFFRFVLF